MFDTARDGYRSFESSDLGTVHQALFEARFAVSGVACSSMSHDATVGAPVSMT
jgi:hypothetical protein